MGLEEGDLAAKNPSSLTYFALGKLSRILHHRNLKVEEQTIGSFSFVF